MHFHFVMQRSFFPGTFPKSSRICTKKLSFRALAEYKCAQSGKNFTEILHGVFKRAHRLIFAGFADFLSMDLLRDLSYNDERT